MTSRNITLDYSKSNKYIFNHNDNLFEPELRQVKSLIKEQLESECTDDFVNYNTIFINGSRGSGKTSFAYTLLDNISNDKSYNSSIEILDFFDPTMIEKDAEIFLTVISLIKMRVKRKFDEAADSEIRFRQLCSWEQYLDKLAQGLLFIDGSKNPQQFWDDPVHIMYKGFDEVNASFNLRKNFRSFVRESLKLLGKKFFLVVIDDVDTNTEKAAKLLEILRKYLCIPEFIVIITGDINLYESIVEKEKNDIDKDKNFELGEQYLRKILPVNKRISLRTLKEIHGSSVSIDNELVKICIVTQNGDSFSEYLRSLFVAFGVKSSYIRQAYLNYIMNQPLRTQIDFYRLFFSGNDDRIMFDVGKLYDVFGTDLKNNGIDFLSATDDSGLICAKLLRFLIKNDCLNECYQLQPISQNKKLNTVLFSSSLILSKIMKDSCKILFDCFFRIAYIKCLALIQNKNRYSVKRLNIEDIISYSGLYNDIDLRQVSCYILAYLRQFSMSKSPANGTLTLKGFAEKAKGSAEERKYTFDGVMNDADIPDLLKCVACLPLSVSSFSNKNSSVIEYSFFTLIASVYDLLCEMKMGNDLGRVLPRIAQIKKYPVPSEVVVSNDDNPNIELAIALRNDGSGFSDFIEQFRAWKNYAESLKDMIPPYLLGKICTRIFYSFDNIEKSIDENISLGDIMHLFICELFHATLIEEFTELSTENASSWNDIYINNNNISTGDSLLINNLGKIVEVIKLNYLPLTKIMVTCPIFMYFLHITDKNQPVFDLFYTSIDSMVNDQDATKQRFRTRCSYEYFKDNNLYQTLSQIKLKTPKGHEPQILPVHLTDSETKLLEKVKQYCSLNEFLNSRSNSKLREALEPSNSTVFSSQMYRLRKKISENPALWQ